MPTTRSSTDNRIDQHLLMLANIACRSNLSIDEVPPCQSSSSETSFATVPVSGSSTSRASTDVFSNNVQPPRTRRRASALQNEHTFTPDGKRIHTRKVELSNTRAQRMSRKSSVLGPLPRHDRKVRAASHVIRSHAWVEKELSKIVGHSNSPVDKYQLKVLRMVYDEITCFPVDRWHAIIAICIHRTRVQVKNWFSNERQKNKCSIEPIQPEGTGLKLLPSAMKASEDWSDDILEGIVRLKYFTALCHDD